MVTQKQPTSIDVARLAGVAQSTVSRAFDPNSRISSETRTRVKDAAETLGYQPNVIARSLSTQRTNIIGILMANLTGSQFYAGVLEKFTHRLQEKGKQILLLNAPPGHSVDEILPRVLGYQVDALIIASTTPDNETIDVSHRGGRPVILFNRFLPHTNASIVCCDNVHGGQLVADFLMNGGYRRLAYIAGPLNTTTNRMREQGFTEQLQRHGYNDLVREQACYSYEAGCEAARSLLSDTDRPDAIFCAADIIAMGVMDIARYEFGLQIPNDLAVVGFDDIPVAGWSPYNLTTVRQPVDAMIAVTLELLERHEQGTVDREVKLLPVEMVVRGSTRS
jgi:DNA-binding LacI/PurR family transcriptional regulator